LAAVSLPEGTDSADELRRYKLKFHRFRSRADFEPTDLRLIMPRFSEENFSKNVKLADKFQAVADKYKATSSQVALAWILADHPNCSLYPSSLCHTFADIYAVIPIPGSRDVGRVEENGSSAELHLDPVDIKSLREFIEAADVQGERLPAQYETFPTDSIPLGEWKGE
jgi:aryl-alcohol dehydrogenase-like predicted oxidoreductase